MGDDGGGNSGNNTRSQRDTKVATLAKLVGRRSHGVVDGVSSGSLNSEFGHGVGDLLEKDGAKTSVKSTNSILGKHFTEAVSQSAAEVRVRDGANSDSLKRAEEDVSDGLSSGSGSKVNRGLHLPSLLLSETPGGIDLEKLDSAKLEETLDEVSPAGGAKASEESSGSLLTDDLLESTDQALVVLGRVKLDTSLDHINRGQGSVSDTAADTSSQTSLQIVTEVKAVPVGRRGGEQDGVFLGSGIHHEICYWASEVIFKGGATSC